MAKEIKQWITINGKHIPIFEGESKEDAVKRVTNKKDDTDDKKEKEDFGGEYNGKRLTEKEMDEVIEKEYDPDAARRAQIDALKKRAQEKQEEKKADKEESDKSGIRKRIANGDYDHQQGKNMNELESELKKNGLELESADAHDMRNSKSFNDEKVTLYDKDGTVYEGTYNRYSDGGREVVDIKPKKNYLNFEQAKRDGRIDKDADYEDFVDYSPIKDDPNYTKKRIARETADENDAYDRAHKEGRYEDNDIKLDSDRKRARESTRNAEAKDRYQKDWNGLDDEQKANIDKQLKDNHPDWYDNKEPEGRNMPARSQEQVGKYDKYKQGFYYDRAKEVNVNGNTYKVWSDQNYKGTFAEDKDGNVLPISGSGYLSNELSQRKAIANKFGESSFRSKSNNDYIISQNSEGQELKIPRKTYEDRLKRAREYQQGLRDLKGTTPEDHRKAREQVEQLENALKTGKSIKIGNKEVSVTQGPLKGTGIHDTRMKQTVKAIKGGLNDLKEAPLGDLKELAIMYGGKTSSEISGMSKEELRKMLLSMWRK